MPTRMIPVSTDVYAAIWSARRSGEDCEDDILRRTFGIVSNPTPTASPSPPKSVGFKDARFDIELPEGFEIFRTYLGVEYKARATNGRWLLLSNGQTYPSLNQLSKAIGTGVENAWYNWYFTGKDGKRTLVTALRTTTMANLISGA
jgi:hypothetical protein